MPVTPATRRTVLTRDEHQCYLASEGGCGRGLTMQHRMNRQMGGSLLTDTPPWLVTLCGTHNDALESSSRWRSLAIARGLKIERRSEPHIDPTLRPVLDALGRWWMLTTDGRREPLPF